MALVGAVTMGRLMSSLLFGIGPMDGTAYVAALGVTVAAAALASYVRASRGHDRSDADDESGVIRSRLIDGGR